MAMAVTPPAAADKVVETAVLATMVSAPMIANCDPGLKPYHPTQRINVPKTTNEALCPGIATTRPSGPNLPVLGPTIIAPIKPATPPVM